jgi:hypothetical protein
MVGSLHKFHYIIEARYIRRQEQCAYVINGWMNLYCVFTRCRHIRMSFNTKVTRSVNWPRRPALLHLHTVQASLNFRLLPLTRCRLPSTGIFGGFGRWRHGGRVAISVLFCSILFCSVLLGRNLGSGLYVSSTRIPPEGFA